MRAYLGIDIDYIDVSFKIDSLSLQKVKSQHLTLYFWDDLPENTAQKISEKLQNYQHEQFIVDATQMYAFPCKNNPDVIVLQFNFSDKLTELRNDVLLYLDLQHDEEFEPHITLYRKKKLDSSFKRTKEFLQYIPKIKINISNISLYFSDPEKEINKYELIEKKILS